MQVRQAPAKASTIFHSLKAFWVTGFRVQGTRSLVEGQRARASVVRVLKRYPDLVNLVSF